MRLNKKGFTLVELLAVIVILAVIMLVAVTAVGPAINNSKKGAFFSSASALNDAAALYVANEAPTIPSGGLCKEVSTLITAGYLQSKDTSFVGKVLIEKDGNNYSYKITATNNDFHVSGKKIEELRNADGAYVLEDGKATTGLTC